MKKLLFACALLAYTFVGANTTASAAGCECYATVQWWYGSGGFEYVQNSDSPVVFGQFACLQTCGEWAFNWKDSVCAGLSGYSGTAMVWRYVYGDDDDNRFVVQPACS